MKIWSCFTLINSCLQHRDIFFIGLNVPPCESAVYGVTQNGYGIETLEQCVIDFYMTNLTTFTYLYVVIWMHELVARMELSTCWLIHWVLTAKKFSKKEIHRTRQKNVFGNQLIDFCSMFNCSIVNGLSDRGFDDGFTYVSNTGSNVIDYIIVSNDLFSVEFVSSFEIAPCVESSHLPLSIYARAN